MMVVAHNAERTLDLALASVIAQTEEDWECIVVDDGSSRSAVAVVETLSDRRIRLIRLDENHGRGYARSRALEAMRGRLCAFLDADDWMYPTRLERQIAHLESDPHLKLVSSSLLVEDRSHRVLGVCAAGSPRRRRLGSYPFSFAPMLVDGDTARRIGFRPELTRSEDIPFLIRALEAPWACIKEPLYVYRPSPPTRASVLESHRCSRHAYSLERAGHPFSARRLEVLYGLRELVHRALPEPMSSRLTALARKRVVRPASIAERRDHGTALSVVSSVLESKSTTPAGATVPEESVE
jgi:teichuronic acid biosynthesis glycosyltransferase TuaG